MTNLIEAVGILVFFGGALIVGLWKGEIIVVLWGLAAGKLWVGRAEDPWRYWFVASFYGVFTALGAYLLGRALAQ